MRSSTPASSRRILAMKSSPAAPAPARTGSGFHHREANLLRIFICYAHKNSKALIQRRKGSRTSCQRGSESIERRLQDRGGGQRAHENQSKECPKGNKCRGDRYLSGNAPSNTRTAAPLTRGTSFLPLVETSTS